MTESNEPVEIKVARDFRLIEYRAHTLIVDDTVGDIRASAQQAFEIAKQWADDSFKDAVGVDHVEQPANDDAKTMSFSLETLASHAPAMIDILNRVGRKRARRVRFSAADFKIATDFRLIEYQAYGLEHNKVVGFRTSAGQAFAIGEQWARDSFKEDAVGIDHVEQPADDNDATISFNLATRSSHTAAILDVLNRVGRQRTNRVQFKAFDHGPAAGGS